MGIQGLLPLLKSITEPVHVKEYAGKRVAVDTYAWLHRGAISCSKDLVEGTHNTRYVDFCMHRVKLLQYHGITPVLVFDGAILPMKSEIEQKRVKSRQESLLRAQEYDRAGNSSAAVEAYKKAIDITPQIAHKLIQELRRENIEYIVAPYEADAQMAFLAKNGFVHAVITEDSDMIPFFCPRVLFKMDKYGKGMEIQLKNLPRNKDLNFSNFTPMMVREMCIFSGCDYLPSLPGLGIRKAFLLIQKFKSYQKAIRNLIFTGVSVPNDYEENFKKALLTFQHQLVFDPNLEILVHLNPAESSGENLDFAGPEFPRETAVMIAKGIVDPISLKIFEDEVQIPDDSPPVVEIRPSQLEIMPLKFKSPKRKKDLPIQKNNLSKYFVPVSSCAKSTFKPPRLTPSHSSQDSPFVLKVGFSQGSESQETPKEELTPNFYSQTSEKEDKSFVCFPSKSKENSPRFGSQDSILGLQNLTSDFDSLKSAQFEESQKIPEDSPLNATDWDLTPEMETFPEISQTDLEEEANVFAELDENGSIFSPETTGLSPVWRSRKKMKENKTPITKSTQKIQSAFFDSPKKVFLEDFESQAFNDAPQVEKNNESEPSDFPNEESENLFSIKSTSVDVSKLLDDPALKEFSTDISHVGEYVEIGHSAISKFEKKLGEFRHSGVLPKLKYNSTNVKKFNKKTKQISNSIPKSQKLSLDDFTFTHPVFNLSDSQRSEQSM